MNAARIESPRPVADLMLTQFLVWTVVVLGVPVVLLEGPRLRSRFGDDVARAMRTFLAVGVAVIFLADVPLLHSEQCAMSPGAISLEVMGFWWFPNVFYSSAALLAVARYVEQPFAMRAWILPPWIAVALVGALFLEGSTQAQPSFPWWGAHALFQLLLLPSIWVVFRGGMRRAALVLPVFAALLPFGPWSFWHACVRLRPGDSVETVVEKLGGFWKIQWGRKEIAEDEWDLGPRYEVGPRLRVRELDPRVVLDDDGSVSFAATGEFHADSCNAWFSKGRLTSFSMWAD